MIPDTLHEHGFSSYHAEVKRFEQNAAATPLTDITAYIADPAVAKLRALVTVWFQFVAKPTCLSAACDNLRVYDKVCSV